MIVREQNLVLPGGTDVNAPAFCIDNKVTTLNLTATSSDADYPLVNLANPITFAEWRGTSTIEQQVAVAIASGDSNYVGVAKHNFGTSGREVKVQGKLSVGGFVDITTPFTPADDAPILFLFDVDAYTNLRIVIGAGIGPARMAVFYAGLCVSGERNIYVGHNPITLAERVQVVNGRATSGDFIGRIITGRTNATEIDMKDLTPEWVRSTLRPFIVEAQSRPFFFGWRPSDYPHEVGFVTLTNDPIPSNTRSNGYMSITMSVEGVV